MVYSELIRLRTRRRRRLAARARGVLLAMALLGFGFAFGSGLKMPLPEVLLHHAAKPTRQLVQGPATHVRDGDTIEVRGTPIRIANLDCAERDTEAGREATYRMVELVQRGPLLCRLEGRKSWDREVGTCELPGGRDIGEILIAEGTCDRWRG